MKKEEKQEKVKYPRLKPADFKTFLWLLKFKYFNFDIQIRRVQRRSFSHKGEYKVYFPMFGCLYDTFYKTYFVFFVFWQIEITKR